MRAGGARSRSGRGNGSKAESAGPSTAGLKSRSVEKADQLWCKLPMKHVGAGVWGALFPSLTATRRTVPAARGLFLLVVMCVACNQQASEAEKHRQLELAQQEKLESEKRARAITEAAQAKARGQRDAEEKAALAKKQTVEAQLLSCCEALGKAGFENRNMGYMKGLDACEAAHQKGQRLSDAVDAIRDALKDESLPAACKAE